MTGQFWPDWILLALSLFNFVVLLWLGLTVILNAERRTGGVFLIALTALLGSAFFAAHTAILSIASQTLSPSLNFWWQMGWLPLAALPFAWYAIVLWYSGYGEGTNSPLRRRHKIPLWLAGLGCAALMALLLVAAPLPSFTQVIQLQFPASSTLFGVPWFLIVYPLYILICTGLAFDALHRPGPAPTQQSNAARLRARPWLLATTVVLLVVSVLVSAVIAWVITLARPGVAGLPVALARVVVPGAGLRSIAQSAAGVAWIDLVILLLLALVSLLIGQALVRYEVFSGRTLPRRELRRHWANALLLAIGYSILVGASLAAGLRAIYSLLLTAVLMTMFYALFGWRSYARHEEFMRRLRPFVASTRLYEQMTAQPIARLAEPAGITPAAGEPANMAAATFAALCTDVLNVDYALLVAAGPLGPLVPEPLIFPPSAPPPSLPAGEWTQHFQVAGELCVPIAMAEVPQVAWAVPLWSERGLIGVLLISSPRMQGIFTQEEIEIARATGERLIDLRAGAELARRLLVVQRQRLVESHVLDRQARRVLHDDVLPELHTALLVLSQEGAAGVAAAGEILSRAHRRIADLLRAMPILPVSRPSGHLIDELRRLVEVEMAGQFDEISWRIDPGAVRASETVSPIAAEVVYYALREAVRNAARHGRGGQEQRPLRLIVRAEACTELMIQVEDNGVGALPAAGAADGQGLALHTAMLAVVGATLAMQSQPGLYTRVVVHLPLAAGAAELKQ